ncbi:MAG: tripartite tricarboxylate transporter substrate binding protein [Burkholderiales bacterium]|nr:tripartite tricarboxylate transporter substrate binding protein [Burkholderiales bacterium]
MSMCIASHAALAQTFPSRPVKIIVPFAAGGGPDVETRRMAPKLAEALGGPVVVENRVGAAGIVAAEVAAQAPPDGYTLIAAGVSQVVQKILRPEAKFDPGTSFAPITLTGSAPTVLIVTADTPIRSAKELADAMRARPGQFNYGSGGVGTAAHIAGATFASLLKLNAIHVPYRGSVEIMPALLGGQIQFAFPIAGTGVPHVKSGKARALGVTGAKRLASLPDVPTMKELYGDDLFVQESWGGLWAPAGTPAPVIATLFAATRKAMADPALRAQYQAGGAEVEVSNSPEEFAAFMKAESAKWAKLIQISGAKAE